MPFEMDSTISIHAPREGGDGTLVLGLILRRYFNPRPPRGGRHGIAPSAAAGELFQSTPPARGATKFHAGTSSKRKFQSTPPARGATFTKSRNCVLMSLISIHAHRKEGDATGCSGRRMNRLFQSTPPARGATPSQGITTIRWTFQSTPPAKGATDYPQQRQATGDISIHAPREGGDDASHCAYVMSDIFQSTPPREGGDRPGGQRTLLRGYFNPRPPRRGRRRYLRRGSQPCRFQSTPPAKGATVNDGGIARTPRFQSTPPRRGRPWLGRSALKSALFQSTPPAKGAT